MREWIANHFELDAHDTAIRREALASVTHLRDDAYIIAVNPAILHSAGMPVGTSMVATYRDGGLRFPRDGPLRESPLRDRSVHGENAFFAYTVVRVMGYRWEVALGAVLVAA